MIAVDVNAVGLYMFIWDAFTALTFIGTLRKTRAPQVVFDLPAVLLFPLSAEFFLNTADVGAWETVGKPPPGSGPSLASAPFAPAWEAC